MGTELQGYQWGWRLLKKWKILYLTLNTYSVTHSISQATSCRDLSPFVWIALHYQRSSTLILLGFSPALNLFPWQLVSVCIYSTYTEIHVLHHVSLIEPAFIITNLLDFLFTYFAVMYLKIPCTWGMQGGLTQRQWASAYEACASLSDNVPL